MLLAALSFIFQFEIITWTCRPTLFPQNVTLFRHNSDTHESILIIFGTIVTVIYCSCVLELYDVKHSPFTVSLAVSKMGVVLIKHRTDSITGISYYLNKC